MSRVLVGLMANQTPALPKLIRGEMQKRDMSERKFAKYVGVSHSTINTLADERTSTETAAKLSVEVLIKLARATNTNVITLLVMAHPELERDLAEVAGADAGVLLRSERIQKLPEQVRNAVDLIIFERTNDE